MLSGSSIGVPDTATHAGPHSGDAGRVVDPPHGSEVGEDVPEEPRECIHSGKIPWAKPQPEQGSFIYLNVKASRRRYGAERADPPMPGVLGVEGARPGEETARREVRGGRDPPNKNGSDQAKD